MALDRASFEELFRAHSARVYSIGVRITGDRAIAEDVVQETFVKAYTVADTAVFDDIGAWLGTVARNASLNAIRNRSRTVGLAEEIDAEQAGGVAVAGALLADASPATDPERAAASSEAVRDAWELVDGLGPAARAAIVLRYAEDLPIAAIAEALGKSVNATTVLLHRARGSLRAAYATRVFARTGLAEACRARKDEIVDLVEGRPVSDELREHMASCSPCQQSAADLRGMTRAFAIVPMFVVPATLGTKVAAAVSLAAGAGAATAATGATAATTATAASTGAVVSGAATTAGAATASGATVASGVTAGALTATSGGILATVGQIVVAGLITVAVVGTISIVSGRIGRSQAAAATSRPEAAMTVPSGQPPTTFPGGIVPAGPDGTTVVAATPTASPSTSTVPPTEPTPAVPASPTADAAATPTPRATSRPVATVATPTPRPATTPRPAATPAPTPRPTPTARPTPAPVSTPVPSPTSRATRVRWSVGTSCNARGSVFRAGDVLWLSVRRAQPNAVIRWSLAGTPAARPAGIHQAGALTAGPAGTACAPIWIVPGRADAAGIFRLDVAGSRRAIFLNVR